jgi:sugar phosphate isomerase/epimerase
MKSAITVSLVPQARGGPFVFWDDLEAACASAARLGFHAVEIFPPSPEAVSAATIRPVVEKYGLAVAAIGTGGGWVAHRWHVTHPSPAMRESARAFARRIVEAAGALGTQAIVGSLQGKVEDGVPRDQALDWLRAALEELGVLAERHGQPLLYEPLNRYETNLFNRVGETASFLRSLRAQNIRILADLFHMNIEEASIPEALREAGPLVGHFHFADSNRRAIGLGHTDIAPVVEALRAIGYAGYISGEVLPLPDSETAAAQTLRAMRQHFGPALR